MHLQAVPLNGTSSPALSERPPCNLLQLEEGEKRLELALHYGIAYPRLYHADQFSKVRLHPIRSPDCMAPAPALDLLCCC